MLDHKDICDLARTLGCKVTDLLVLTMQNDPFFAERNGRRKEAEWFASTCRTLGLGYGLHVRRVHYRASISPPVPILKPDGTPYQNTYNDWMLMARASRDARYLGLVPGSWFVDRKNPDPIIHAKFREWRTDPHISVEHLDGFDDSLYYLPDQPRLPVLSLEGFIAEQRYLVELWIEKTTAHDVLEPLARRYGLNLVAFSGEGSETACRTAIQRANQARRPLRILYLSDFDPGGWSMPVAVARKIEYWRYATDANLDATVDPIVLLPEQVEHYGLPRIPIKGTERRAGKFEQAFGEGVVELDALEALHPGELHRIVEQAVLKYIDPDLKDRAGAEAESIEADLREIEERVYDEFAEEIAEVGERYTAIQQTLKDLQNESTELWSRISARLEAGAPHVTADDIPKAPEADQEAPLFDSKRDYLAQLEWYHRWQRRPEPGATP